ncbi:unnamed protein product [Ranitomeya imitator]|uniref:Uncharacterized protein n=1 Tax=Ranitomeya imitator TaxID=111125 RepID=A0ABN9LB60_9NEOB|nr:unnamed protein product [Ranitomeya imitator]
MRLQMLKKLKFQEERPVGAAVCDQQNGSVNVLVVTGFLPLSITIPLCRDKTAVLQALAYTVNHDPTAVSYKFQDDPYLIPTTSTDYKFYSMSKESGKKNAAKYIVNMYPNLFQKDIAEPHIPCLMPENIQPQIESVSEEALNERIKLRRVKESVDLFDQLLQAGTTPSLETTNKLLDLVCFYGDREPSTDDHQYHQEDESLHYMVFCRAHSFLHSPHTFVNLLQGCIYLGSNCWSFAAAAILFWHAALSFSAFSLASAPSCRSLPRRLRRFFVSLLVILIDLGAAAILRKLQEEKCPQKNSPMLGKHGGRLLRLSVIPTTA